MTTLAAGYGLADLLFDEATHTTKFPDGTDVPHVTTILSAVGLTTDFEELASGSERRRRDIEYRRNLGQVVHADCHAYDDDDLDLDAVHGEVRPYVMAWARFRENYGLRPKARERQLYSRLYHYTGRLDGVFDYDAPLRSGGTEPRVVLADIKIGDPEDAAAHLQTAAYEHAWCECGGPAIQERWAVWLRPDQAIPYKVINYTRPDRPHWDDFPTFAAAVAVFNSQPGRRRRIR